MFSIPKDRRTYVLICGFSNVVAGGPIYHRNKIKYLEERGWNVVVIPIGVAENVRISGLEKYEGKGVTFLHFLPSEFSRKQLNEKIDILQSYIPHDAGEVIIETGTYFSAYWGEALAQRLGAKHFFVFIDEHFDEVNSGNIAFYKFKYDRHELACINADAMFRLFQPYYNIPIENCYGVRCCCHNTLEDIESPFTDRITRGDYNIGSIGRLEKGFVPVIIEGVMEFAQKHPDKSVVLNLFGGAYEDATINQIRETIGKIDNITLNISGYLHPLPIKALKKCDIFLSGAGSAHTTPRLGIPTVNMDLAHFQPLGYVKNPDIPEFCLANKGNRVINYLEQALVEKNPPLISCPEYNTALIWKDICHAFDAHMQFLSLSSGEKEYFDVTALPLHRKQKVKKIMRCLLGLRVCNLFMNASGF